MNEIVFAVLMAFMAFLIGAFVCVVVFFIEFFGFWNMILAEIYDTKKKIIADVILHIVIFAIGIPAIYFMLKTGAFTNG